MYVDRCVSVVDLQTCWKNYKSIHRIKHLQDNTYYLLEHVVVASIWYCSTVPTYFCSRKSFPWIVGKVTRAWSNSPRSFEWSGDGDEGICSRTCTWACRNFTYLLASCSNSKVSNLVHRGIICSRHLIFSRNSFLLLRAATDSGFTERTRLTE